MPFARAKPPGAALITGRVYDRCVLGSTCVGARFASRGFSIRNRDGGRRPFRVCIGGHRAIAQFLRLRSQLLPAPPADSSPSSAESLPGIGTGTRALLGESPHQEERARRQVSGWRGRETQQALLDYVSVLLTPQLVLQATNSPQHPLGSLSVDGRDGFDRIAQFLGPAAGGVVILPGGLLVQPAKGLLQLPKTAVDHLGSHGEGERVLARWGRGRGLRERLHEVVEPLARCFRIEAPQHLRPGFGAFGLEVAPKRRERAAVRYGESAGEPCQFPELHVEVAHRTKHTEEGFDLLSRPYESPRQVLGKESQCGIDAPSSRPQIMQPLRIIS